ncbi:extracellular solute-binding protein [Paenibacillus sp. F411]|uniref:extracellular solute-binding protein n=1 Tax=Paenibacillus sp. F411 TaxID=2820239 RepID=UPI001AAE9DE0|nr:extracellular solute-binding protein [Paenibacillus sp. F411]MBO2942682.1 extracellular solute-binding protein [Paenibacillus sp. F411]
MKKWGSFTLAALLALGTLTGCAQEAATPEKPATNSEGKAAEGTDQGKAEFSISMRTLAFNHVEKSPNINEDKWVKKLEEITNTDLDIVLVPHKDYEQKMLQMFATNDIPDVVQGSGGVNGKEMGGSVQAGVFQPLDDLLQEHGQNLLKVIPKDVWANVSYEGKIYGIPEWLSNPSRRATWIRMDLLEKSGLPVPVTVDDYMNVMRKFKEMGVENPYMGRENFRYSDTFFGAYDVFPYQSMFEKQGDQIVPKFMDNENMMQALTTYKTMYDEGLINKEFATINPTKFKETILSGKAGIWTMNANELLQWEQQLKAAVPDAKVAIIPSPVGPDGSGGHYLYGSVSRAYFINQKVENPEKIIQFFDWMVSEEAEKFFSFGIEGENYTVENGKINYKAPVTPQEVDEERYRQAFLWMVQDTTYNKGTLELSEQGQKLIKVYDDVLAKEGRDGISFEPRLDAFQKNPDISPISDQAPPVILNHMVKIVYGKEPVSDWPKAVEEWKSKGGDEVIKEATEKYNNQQGVLEPRR